MQFTMAAFGCSRRVGVWLPTRGLGDPLSRLGSLLKVGNYISGPFGCLFSLDIPINALYVCYYNIVLYTSSGGFHCSYTLCHDCYCCGALFNCNSCVMLSVLSLCCSALQHWIIMIQCYIDSVIIVLLCFTALCHNDSVLH